MLKFFQSFFSFTHSISFHYWWEKKCWTEYRYFSASYFFSSFKRVAEWKSLNLFPEKNFFKYSHVEFHSERFFLACCETYLSKEPVAECVYLSKIVGESYVRYIPTDGSINLLFLRYACSNFSLSFLAVAWILPWSIHTEKEACKNKREWKKVSWSRLEIKFFPFTTWNVILCKKLTKNVT